MEEKNNVVLSEQYCFCESCGTKNNINSNFCSSCGKNLLKKADGDNNCNNNDKTNNKDSGFFLLIIIFIVFTLLSIASKNILSTIILSALVLLFLYAQFFSSKLKKAIKEVIKVFFTTAVGLFLLFLIGLGTCFFVVSSSGL